MSDPALVLPPVPWWTDVLFYIPILAGLALVWWVWSRGGGFNYLKKQSDFLDFQKSANECALEQNKSALEQNRAFETAVARQYEETNERADRALAQSAEALRLHAAALDQLTRIHETMARMAASMESGPRETPG